MTVISYPIPAFQNLPIDSQFYVPSRFVITDLTLGLTTTVTVNSILNFAIGQKVRLIIPPGYGSRQLNERQGIALSFPTTTSVELDIDSSRNVDQFIAAAISQTPQLLPIGEVNTGVQNQTGRTNQQTFIPGSFINISPE